MPRLSKRWWRSTFAADPVQAPAYSQHDQSSHPEKTTESLSLLQDETADSDLWRKALKTVQAEFKWNNFLNEIHADDEKTLDCVNSIQSEALERANSTKNNERSFHLPGGRTYTYRQIYENVATYANKFQVVGDLLVQADPGYATVPWVRSIDMHHAKFPLLTCGPGTSTLWNHSKSLLWWVSIPVLT